ncbi:uncharacterized protein LOC111328357 [Stylophora pistillata]|nr:uncharacterized protein LOC111328357 [Stylophora pistillata]
METLSLIFVIFLPQMCASHTGHAKTKQSDRKRNFLADAMREMESGGKASSHASSVRKVPNVIRVVMRPEVPPSRHRHHRHHHGQFDGLKSVLRLSEGVNKLSNQHNENHKNKATQILDAENKLQETVRFLERVNGQLNNISKSHDHKQKLEKVDTRGNITLKGDDEVMVTDSFPLFPELRSIVEHGKPFNPDVTRAAFARAKQIVWDSVGQDPLTSADVGHLNNTKLTNAVALLEMAVREAEKMERNKTKSVDQETNHQVNSPKIPETQTKVNHSKHSDAQLKVLRQLLLEELKQTNLTEDGAGHVLISDIPFQKMRNQKQSRLTQKPFSSPGDSSTGSKVNPRNKNQPSGTQTLLENYTSFITNLLKAAHLSVSKNITKDSSSTPVQSTSHAKLASESEGQQPVIHKQNALLSTVGLKLNTTKEQQEEHRLSFANVAQEQKQQQRQQQHIQPVDLPKERLDARKAFGTAQKLVKAMLARQELYKAEADFFNKIHEMLNESSKYPLNTGPEKDARESRITSQPTVASPIKSPLSQSPLNTASSPSLSGEDNKKQPSESQKKFDEAAHLEEKVAAQQDLMYDALLKGHTIGTVKGGGGGTFEEEGAVRENTGQEGLDDSYNTEDYGDFKDSDEEAEKKFYHDHNQDNFEAKEMEDTTLGLRDKIIQLIPERTSIKESSGIDIASSQTGNMLYENNLNYTFGESGDSSGDRNARENDKTRRTKYIYRKRKLLGKL